MKNKTIYSCMLVMLIALGCKKDFLAHPTNELDLVPETVFNNELRTSGFLANIYANMYNEGLLLNNNNWGYSSLSDEISDPIIFDAGQAWINGSINSQSPSLEEGLGGLYVSQYTRIRRCNLMMKYQNLMTFDPNVKKQFLAEARFLRAFFYFELLKRYGGVPLVTEVTEVSTLTDIAGFEELKKSVKRATFKETVDFILADLAAAKADLIWFPSSDNDRGRATAAAAVALKSRLLLYAASPLFNGTETNKLISYGDSDPHRWKLAADAAREFFALNVTNGNAHELYNSYPNLFTAGREANNKEIIWYRQNFPYVANNFVPGRAGNPGFFTFAVTGNQVALYETSTGKAIDEPGSNYNPANPFANRDPRLGYNVVKNGDVFKGFIMELYPGGSDYNARTITGVFMRKGVPQNGNVTGQKWHYIRLAEIYLNLAEAINESEGPTAEAIAAINAIRNRTTVKMPLVTQGITVGDFRQKVRRERSVELAFESHRFFDLRRWKSDELNNDIIGNVPVLTGNAINWTEVLLNKNAFNNRMYFYPFPFV
ncbi:MAG TPA: RagB/SusD family nutrient uptake outer membrane protein, partial [Pedobacter sp.]|nr:RagB/SusD family nutrient uptake outer membrane protein [Pedobacter sp.]